MIDNFNDKSGVLLQGHIKIHNPESGEILVDKRNAIHYENMSISLAESFR
jgi:ABC-type cobalamin/Fe3+-siderophores transport system ATPase subunit